MTRTLLISCCVLLGAAFAWADDIPNLIRNPGFEELDARGWAAGWDIWPPELPEAGAVSIDSEAPGGRRALRLRHAQGTSGVLLAESWSC